jgi:chromosomal replication initiator protein
MSAAQEWQVSYRWMGKRRRCNTSAASIEEAIERTRAHQESMGRSIVVLRAVTIAEESKADATLDIANAVAKRFGVTVADVYSETKDRDAALARQVCMYIARHRLGLSYPRIARAFNRKDHTTAHHAVRKIEHMVTSGKLKLVTLTEISAELSAT